MELLVALAHEAGEPAKDIILAKTQRRKEERRVSPCGSARTLPERVSEWGAEILRYRASKRLWEALR
jgi:hypothetical protein